MTETLKDPTPYLSDALMDQIREKIGLDDDVPLTLAGLTDIYETWCQKVPFCSTLKRVHIATNAEGAFPATHAEDFFDAYLAHGTGGTCFSTGEAFYQFLRKLGFDVRRVAGTMLDFPLPGPNHGSVVATIDGIDYMVDPFFGSEIPLPLHGAASEAIKSESRQVKFLADTDDHAWIILWRFPFGTTWMRCGMEDEHLDVPHSFFDERYQASGGPNSAFNTGLYISIHDGPATHAIYKNFYHIRRPDQPLESRPIDLAERNALLKDVFKFSDEMIALLPPDEPEPEAA